MSEARPCRKCGVEGEPTPSQIRIGYYMCRPCRRAYQAARRQRTTPGPRSLTNTVWHNMLARCENPRARGYQNYGGIGIRVCERWHSFANFLEDMGFRPPGLTLERLDNSKGYEPGNCRWATTLEQGRNRRTNRLITINGETLNMSAWAERYGISPHVIFSRLRYGWPEELAVTTPVSRSGNMWLARRGQAPWRRTA